MAKPIAVDVTDTHLDDGNVETVLDALSQVVAYCCEHGIGRMIHKGDWFTSRQGQSLTCLLAMVKFLTMCEDADITIYTFPGNHDKTDQSAKESYVDVFARHPNLKIVRDYGCFSWVKGLHFHMIPYFTKKEYLKNLIHAGKEAEKKGGINDMFTHISVNGVMNNDGSLVEDGIHRKLFKPFRRVNVGHYHNPSKFGNIHYNGSLIPLRHGENDQKGFQVIYADGTYEMQRVNFRSFIKVEIECNDAKALKKYIKQYLNTEHHVRFAFHGNRDDFTKIDVGYLESIGIDVRFENTNNRVNTDSAIEKQSVVFEGSDMMKNFLDYCVDNEVSKTKKVLGINYLRRHINPL